MATSWRVTRTLSPRACLKPMRFAAPRRASRALMMYLRSGMRQAMAGNAGNGAEGPGTSASEAESVKEVAGDLVPAEPGAEDGTTCASGSSASAVIIRMPPRWCVPSMPMSGWRAACRMQPIPARGLMQTKPRVLPCHPSRMGTVLRMLAARRERASCGHGAASVPWRSSSHWELSGRSCLALRAWSTRGTTWTTRLRTSTWRQPRIAPMQARASRSLPMWMKAARV